MSDPKDPSETGKADLEPPTPRRSRRWVVLALLGLALACGVLLAAASWFMSQLTDPGLDLTQAARQAEAVMTLDPYGQAAVQGEIVASAPTGCFDGPESCYMIVQNGDARIFVYYNLSLDGDVCRNTKAAREAETFGNGEIVEVFGKRFSGRGISTCDSSEYYIRQISP